MNLLYLCIFLCFLKLSLGFVYSRYSGVLTEYEVVLPRKVKPCGSFSTFRLDHFFDSGLERRKRSLSASDEVHYRLRVGGSERHIRLRPNLGVVSPGMLVEHWYGRNLSDRHLSSPAGRRCLYHGEVTGSGERTAMSLCSGLLGLVRTNGTMYYVEPMEEVSVSGERLHVVYKRSAKPEEHSCDSSRDWVNSWAREIYLSLKESENNIRVSRSSVMEVVPRYMELCVVSDLKFIQFHKSRNVEEYVLSIMNMVADFYHDESIGNLIDVVVVRLVFLHKEKEEIDLDISPNATTTLDNFCKWQVGLNPKDPNHPNHHDLAVLLTRHDICSDDKAACGLLGLAYVGTACSSTRNCCINEDTGLMLAATVAHELGHNMGCAHDSPEETGCQGKLPNGSGTVMAPTVGSVLSSTWSNCSKEFISNLLLNQLGECLLDEPKEQNYESPNMPIGAIYDADAQCKFVFGEDFIRCDIGGEKVCEELWCKQVEGKKCVSRGHMVADGTPCAPNHWCYGKECVPVGKRPPTVDGGWSTWGNWIECSRTCGGGVAMRERLCINPKPQNGGRYCTGLKRDYKLCNTMDCDPSQPAYRQAQCTEHNSIPFKGQMHTWAPYPSPESDPNPCVLYCINDKNTIVKLEQRVKDGTRCRAGKKDTCIHGSCVHVGCDWGIDSKAVEDICGECNGDGTRCTIIEEIYNITKGNGYVKITTIPKGSNNVAIFEIESSENMIAIGRTEKNIYFNKNYTEQAPGEYKIGEAFAVYTKPEKSREELHIRGPLREDILLFYVYFREENPGVKYKYSIPKSQPNKAAKYKWEYLEWEECSVKCGGGTQMCKPTCVEETAGKVADKYCNAKDRPDPKTMSCNLQKCKSRWKTWAWGPCSGCMYRTGERRRDVECVMELSSHGDGDEVIVPEEECCGSKPPDTELCNSSRPCNSTDTTNCTRRKRWDDGLDEKFRKFSYNLSGIEESVSRFCKRSTGHWLSSNCSASNTQIVLDKQDPNEFILKTVNLTNSNDGLIGNMSEQDFESVAAMVPKFSADQPKIMTGKNAIHKFGKITNNSIIHVDDMSEEPSFMLTSEPTTKSTTEHIPCK